MLKPVENGMNPTLEIEGLSVVILGTFNPQIFQPQWFASQNLIRSAEAENATVQIISSDISVFSLGWLGVEIARERATFGTNQAQNYELLRDLVASTFKLLRHTPLTRLGLNWACHYKIHDIESYHNIGHKLAPKEPWNEILRKPAMLDVTMQGDRPDSYPGKINVTVQPSVSIIPGVYFLINDDFDLQNLKANENAPDKMVSLLNSELQHSLQRRNQVTNKILET